MPTIRTITAALDPSSPAKTAILILLPAMLLTVMFANGIGSPMYLPRLTTPSPSVLDQAVGPILNRSGVPQMPSVDPSLTQKASGVANKSMDIADDALDSVDVAVETGGRVIDFGANLVDQALRPSVRNPLTHPASGLPNAAPSVTPSKP